jgi:hypothetical protein
MLLKQIPSAAPIMPYEAARHATNHPLLAPVGLACALTGFISYNSTRVGPLAFIFFLGSSVIAIWSFWVVSN